MHRALRLRRAVASLSHWRAARPSSSAVRALTSLSSRSILQNSLQSTAITRSFASVDLSIASLTEEQRDNVVKLLKTRCNALFDDNKAHVAPSEALLLWLEDVQTLQTKYETEQLKEEVERAYETGVAIASKQKQFELAKELTKQMQQLGFTPTERIHQYLIRNVALELRSGSTQTSLEDLRELLKDVTDDMWEREIMSVVEREKRPLHLKTDKEFELFQQRLIAGIEAQLDEYERTISAQDKEVKMKRSTVPYNEALRVYVDNNVKFGRMLELMVKRDLVVDVETYEALLLGARWNEIPAALSQLLDSKLVDELTASNASDHVHRLWVNAMKAIVRSSTERFSSLSASVYKRDVDQLRKVFVHVDKRLSNAFPKFSFATSEQYDEVYTMRIKAAAACGLIAPMKRLLDEYVERAPSSANGEKPVLSKEPFLTALEIFPWSLMDVLMLSREDALARAEGRDVARSPHVMEMRKVYERVMQKLVNAQQTIEDTKRKLNEGDVKLDDDEHRALVDEQNSALQIVEKESRTATTVERRLDNARVLKANQVLIKELLDRADLTVGYALNKFVFAGFDVENDLDVRVKLMEQYMKSARRLDRRLSQREKHVSPHMMQRIFKEVNTVTENVQSGGIDAQNPENREKLTKLFENAVCAAVRFWRNKETDALVRRQQRLLGTLQLGQSEYDELIFQRATNLDVRGAHSLLQEMHNAGMKPSQEAIHRIALGLLYQPLDSDLTALLTVSDKDAIEHELGLELEGDDGDDKLSTESAAAERTLLLGSDAPVSIEDLIGFLQDWYNLYGVVPLGKTVVPVLAQLLDSSNFPEFRRLLQILESMEGGLTPATQLWLEKRLDRLGGKTLDDFRLQK
eukprot:jgi/Phyca11/106333/e_gw1.12.116.1